MLASALGAISDRLDSKFLIAYWLPAFVAVLGGFGILALLVGAGQIDDWVYGLDSVEQTLAVLIVVLAVTMLAFVLRALSRPIVEMFTGSALPRFVAEWSTRGQLRFKEKAELALRGTPDRQDAVPAAKQSRAWLNQVYPVEDDDIQPTLFGNVLATAVEHPKLAYMMEGLLWWPRLSPLVPVEFQGMLGGAQAPMLALLNLSVVFTGLALSGALILGLAGGNWLAAIAMLLVGLLLSRLCYRAGVSQAAELGSMIRVGFDLYRHDILRQMDLEVPADLAAERALWRQLTTETLGSPHRKSASSKESTATTSTDE